MCIRDSSIFIGCNGISFLHIDKTIVKSELNLQQVFYLHLPNILKKCSLWFRKPWTYSNCNIKEGKLKLILIRDILCPYKYINFFKLLNEIKQ